MLLFTDGGSTKCDWVVLDNNKEIILKTRTKGLNPAVLPRKVLTNRILENKALLSVAKKITRLDFYGAGCGTAAPSIILKNILQDIFVNATITVKEDTLAAVHAITKEPSIVCILGTGSNSCYYDGNKIHLAIPSLGYIIMDEASGNYYGKRLIRDYFYNRMPTELRESFKKKFDLNTDSIKRHLYKEPNPNTYLASFAEFIFANEEMNGYFYKLLSEGINNFIKSRILCYKEAQQVPIHFIGSIAHFSKEIIEDAMKPYHLSLGKIVRRPIDGLIKYYQKQSL